LGDSWAIFGQLLGDKVKFEKWVKLRVQEKVVFLERSGQIQFFWGAQVIISQQKSTEVVNIFWFGHSTLLLFFKN